MLRHIDARMITNPRFQRYALDLAEELGISRQHLAAIEAPNMNRGLSLELLFNIATVLEIEPYLLLKFSRKMTLTIPAMKAQTKSPSPALFRFPGCSPAPAGLIFLRSAPGRTW